MLSLQYVRVKLYIINIQKLRISLNALCTKTIDTQTFILKNFEKGKFHEFLKIAKTYCRHSKVEQISAMRGTVLAYTLVSHVVSNPFHAQPCRTQLREQITSEHSAAKALRKILFWFRRSGAMDFISDSAYLLAHLSCCFTSPSCIIRFLALLCRCNTNCVAMSSVLVRAFAIDSWEGVRAFSVEKECGFLPITSSSTSFFYRNTACICIHIEQRHRFLILVVVQQPATDIFSATKSRGARILELYLVPALEPPSSEGNTRKTWHG